MTLSLNTLYCHILICKVSLTYVQAFLSYKRLKFSLFSGFDSFPWDFRGNFFSRYALLVTPNAHTKFHQNRLMGQFSMEVRTTSLIDKPKILFFDCCRPDQYDSDLYDVPWTPPVIAYIHVICGKVKGQTPLTYFVPHATPIFS